MRSLRCQINPNKLHEGQLTAAVLKPVPFAASCWWSLVRKNVTRTVFERICLRNTHPFYSFLTIRQWQKSNRVKKVQERDLATNLPLELWDHRTTMMIEACKIHTSDWVLQHHFVQLGTSYIFQATRKAPLQDESMSDKNPNNLHEMSFT